jgi:hypothetical protein
MLNVAVTALAASIVTEQVPVPVHAPLQLANVDPVEGAAVKVTLSPWAKLPVHETVQLIPDGVLVTVPLPVPAMVSVSANVGLRSKVAVTVVSAPIAKVQGASPEQPPPLHPMKTDPTDDAAVNVTCVPLSRLAEQVDPQLIPPALLVTVPEPVPFLFTLSVNVGIGVNVAVTDLASSIVTTQPAAPVQAPDHPEKSDPLTGTAIRVTLVPLAKFAEQEAVQLMPGGALVTVPLPEPAIVREIGDAGNGPGVGCFPESSGQAVISSASPAQRRRNRGRPARVAIRMVIEPFFMGNHRRRPKYKRNRGQCFGASQVSGHG